ncbi:hypothetical protein [Streptococcus uberis]|uniref:hypothetical protein n=1 Tax=Streptococcus uberis TaxID=1349 RepID=UPI001FF130B1|nr:hypothetical protein [Streptococcus uberis]
MLFKNSVLLNIIFKLDWGITLSKLFMIIFENIVISNVTTVAKIPQHHLVKEIDLSIYISISFLSNSKSLLLNEFLKIVVVFAIFFS